MSEASEAPKPKRPSRARRDWLIVRQNEREALATTAAAESLGLTKTELVRRALQAYIEHRAVAVEALDVALGPPVDD